MELWGIMGMIASIVAVGSFIVYRLAQSRYKDVEVAISSLTEAVHEIRQYPEIGLSEIKKAAFLARGLKTFCYLDERQVGDLYPQVVQGIEPKKIETRETRETRKSIAAKVYVLEPKYEKGSAEETTKTYEVSHSIGMMYDVIEKYLVEKDMLIFGLEDFEFDESSIEEFKALRQKMKSKFDFDIPQGLEEDFVSDRMTEFALQNVERLSSGSGYVVIQSKLSILDIADQAWTLSLTHPLNDYLQLEGNAVAIQFTCAREYITPLGNGIFGKARPVHLTCLGKVVDWYSGDNILEISPIAIY